MAKLLSVNTLDVLEARGSAFERGYAYGVRYKPLIRRLIDSHYDFYVRYLQTSREDALREASQYERPIRDYSEEIAEEIRGTADGADIQPNEVLLVAAFNEVFYPKLSKACTSFAARDKATSDGLTYVGQNNDEGIDPWLDGDCVTLTKYVQKDGPDALIYSYAGAPAMMGMNSSGLSVCINALGFEKTKVGVPMLCIVREVLNQKDLDGAVAAIERADRAYALNFMLGDNKGIVDVEANPLKVTATRSNVFLHHANHYVYGTEGFTDPKSGDSRVNSEARCDRMLELLQSNEGKLNLNTFQEFLRDHANRPNMICAHVNPAKPKAHHSRTLDGMIYIPEKREAWISHGNPCENEFVRYTV
ncbi:MAG: C45 family peptidase [Candidatus Bathyarchaeia archaeon]|jgi:isopenicillin-N N-acyltransferase-like protein